MKSSNREIVYRDSWIPNYVYRYLNDEQVLLMTPSARWCIATKKELEMLDSVALPAELFKKYEDIGVITTRDNALSNFEKYKLWNEGKYLWPDLHIIETTKACNLSCGYCHMSATTLKDATNNGYHLNKNTIQAIIDTVLTSPREDLHIEFQGGESLLNFQVLKHGVVYAKERWLESDRTGNITFSVVTNLTLLKEHHCQFFHEHNISICTTLDGPKYIHDANRRSVKGKSSFNDVCSGLELMHKSGLGAPGVLSVITSSSASQVKELVHMFLDIGVSDISFIFVHSMGKSADNWSDLGLSWAQESESYKQLIDTVFRLWRNGIYVAERKFLVALEKLFSNRDTNFTDFRNPCGMGRGQITYDSRGQVFTCDEARSFGKFSLSGEQVSLPTSISKLVDTPELDDLLTESLPNYQECSSCAYKPICGLCPVQNLSTNMDKNHASANDDHGCLVTQLIFDYCFRMMIEQPDILKSYYMYSKLHPGVSSGNSK